MNTVMKKIISDKLYFIIIAAFVIFSFALIYISMYWGVGLTPDSLIYIRIAESLATGNAADSSQHYPPLYSFLLFLPSVVVDDTLISARWIQILIFLSTIISLAVMLKRITDQGTGWVFIGIFVIFTAPHLFSIYMMAWSEPLFLLLTLAGFYFLAHFISNQKKSILIWSAVFFALAFSTRYVGIVPIGTAILGLIIFSKKHWSERLKNAGFFTFLSLLPMLLWIIWGQVTQEPGIPRVFAYHPISIEKLSSGIEEMLGWFYLSSTTSWVLLSIFLISYIFLTVSCRTADSSQLTVAEIFKKILFLFVPLYLIFLVISISFFDAHTPLDSRILIPVYFFLMIALILGLSSITAGTSFCRIFNISAFLVVLILSFVQITHLQSLVTYFSTNGVGFLSRQWVESDTLAYVRNEQTGRRLIYTNAPEIIEIHLKRKSKFLPQRESATSKKINENFQNSLHQLQQEFKDKDAILIYFYAFSYRTYLPSLAELSANMDMDILYKGKDGIVLQAHD